ncbi:MAG TPA: DUF4340 domain-containing protein [Opitutus sp.]|nr:DUF4340 domain-containing protein [Opitutus sp.]
MRTKVTLVLVFLNVALFFFIFRFERRWRIEESWKESRRRVLGAEASDIRALQITGSDHNLALEKRGDTWFITQPLEWPAEPNAISRIINELQLLEHETSFLVRDLAKNGQSLADYGLDEPKLTLSFTSGDPAVASAENRPPTVLRLGDSTKDGVRLYLLSSDGQRIHVVNQSLARSLALTFDELHSAAIFTIPVFEASSLNLQTAAPASLRIRLHRDGNRWSFDTPIVARASKTKTELAINGLNALRVEDFVTENPPATLPSAKPSLRVSLEGNKRRETLLLGDPLAAGENAPAAGVAYYAQLEGRSALFTVRIPAALKGTLDQAQESLRETRLLDFDPRAVTAITLTAPGQPPLTLQRLETGAPATDTPAWQIVLRGSGTQGPQTLPADRNAVARLLEQLLRLEAKTFPSDAPRDADLESWGFNRPEREVTLTLSGQPSVQLQFGVGTMDDALVYARLPAASASIYGVDPSILRETAVTPRTWREKLLRELPSGARITALKLVDLSNDSVLLDTAIAADGTPAASVSDPAAVATLLAHVRTLRAKEFVLDQFVDRVTVAGEDRPWRYRLDATTMLTGGAGEQTSTTTLFLTPRVGGAHQLAGSPANEFNAVFEIEQPLLDALWKIVEGPRDPGPAEPAR